MDAMAEAEEQGESFWTETFADKVRVRVRRVFDRLGGGGLGDRGAVFAGARRLILDQAGFDFLVDSNLNRTNDFAAYVRTGPDEDFPTAVEALIRSLDDWQVMNVVPLGPRRPNYGAQLVAGINEVFTQERVAWRILDGKMVEMKSQELHQGVVEPALRLIHGKRFSRVDVTYRKALEELSRGDGADAVTDAGTALQELLAALGCTGNQLGDLIQSARGKGLLGAHDTPVLDAIDRALRWVAADRSQVGESHHASEAAPEDAWLIVHVVGAFIVRLAEGTKRPQR